MTLLDVDGGLMTSLDNPLDSYYCILFIIHTHIHAYKLVNNTCFNFVKQM